MNGEVHEKEQKEWCLLVYMAGDYNDLEARSKEDIRELYKEGSSEKIHAVVEVDYFKEGVESKRFEIPDESKSENAEPKEIMKLGESNSGDPDTLKDFLSFGLDNYKAKQNILSIWGHGAGIEGVCLDYNGTGLNAPDIEKALKGVGIDKNNRISVLGFDACSMGMIEIAHQFYNRVDFLVSSQETMPTDGWPYNKVLKLSKEHDQNNVLAKEIVEAYVDEYKGKKKYKDKSLTHTAINVQKTSITMRRLNKLGKLLKNNLAVYRGKIADIRKKKVQDFIKTHSIDLIHFVTLIRNEIDNNAIRTAADRVIEAAEACIFHAKKSGKEVKDAKGLSVWFPNDKSYYEYYCKKYLALKGNAGSIKRGWVEFLDAYHNV